MRLPLHVGPTGCFEIYHHYVYTFVNIFTLLKFCYRGVFSQYFVDLGRCFVTCVYEGVLSPQLRNTPQGVCCGMRGISPSESRSCDYISPPCI